MIAQPITVDRHALRPVYAPRGAIRAAFTRRDPELLLAGPAGTGKTRGLLEKLHLCALKYPGMRGLIVRKTLESLTSSALVTFTELVRPAWEGVTFFGGSKLEPAHFRYPNGSKIVVGGLDKATKIMSAEYDLIVVNEATEVTEDDWERLTTRNRYGVMPYQQLMGDCNPDAPTHWLKQRADRGVTALLETRHEDNPALWDDRREAWTPMGAEYMAILDRLSGVRYLRLRKGVWAAAEGVIYGGWDPTIHLIDRFDIPPDWPRCWVVDFGYVHPFVWMAVAQGHDGALYRYREIYMTGRLVEDHCTQIRGVTAGEPPPVAVICDHDAEGRATLERHLDIITTPATKAVTEGIQGVQNRLRKQGDGKPRLYFLRDSLVERDPSLTASAQPACTEEEFPAYIWDTRQHRQRGEQPVKEHDHGMDDVRYLVAHVDKIGEEDRRATSVSYIGDDRRRDDEDEERW